MVLGLSAALTVTACGSGGSSGTGAGAPAAAGTTAPAAAPTASATPSAAAAPTGAAAPAGPSRILGKAELQAALIATGDLNGYTAMEMPMEIGKEVLSTRPADCQPIENIRTGKIKPAPAAYAFTGVAAGTGSSPTALTQIMLTSLDGGAAHQVLADLKSALTTCTGYEGSIPKRGTVAALPAPPFGEEAVSYTITSDGHAQELTVVRLGSVVAVFSPSALPGASPAKTPQELVARQLEKIRTTTG